MLLFFIGLFACLAVIGYYNLLIKPHSYWRDRGVETEKPLFFFGHWKQVAFKKICAAEHLKILYDKHLKKRCVPLFLFLKPVLLLRDLDLIKQVAVKASDTFTNRSVYLSKNSDPVVGNMMFFLEDDEWKRVRSLLTPAFTRHKLNSLYGLIIDCAEQFTDYFVQISKNETTVAVDIKKEFLKYANDLIATTAFGIKTNSLKDPNNELFKNGLNLFGLTGFFVNLKFLFTFINPHLLKIFKVRVSNKSVSKFFIDIIKTTIKFRNKNNVTRTDMLQLMIEARMAELSENDVKSVSRETSPLTDEILAAQCIMFYMAGFESLSINLSFLMYEIAVNPDVQKKLFEEISETFQSFDGKVSCEALLNMKYLDMVVSESSRKWPSVGVLDRCSKKPYHLTMDDGKQVCIDKNMTIYISVFGIHRDPAYWPNPEKFDPERFNDENKRNIKPYTYMPFGIGPRGCIGNRFSLLAEKAMVACLLIKFQIVPVEKTDIPLKICGYLQGALSSKEYWLGLKPRKAFCE